MTKGQQVRRLKRLINLWYIIRRNVFLLTNGIITAVVVLLFLFGDVHASLFLSLVLVINVSLGLAQDIRAWMALSKLQLLTAPKIIRLREGEEDVILVEDIEKDDCLKLTTGDQIPVDGYLLETEVLEISEGLITGEGGTLSRKKGDYILAGSIITAGRATLKTSGVFKDSRIARMTEGLSDTTVSVSPIQREINRLVTYSGYLLILCIGFVVTRGAIVHESHVSIVKNIGALASALVPQGLVFALTLLFAYGAAHLYRKNVLLQEVNATEKLGRIQNLCMDKTGTLTDNTLIVEDVFLSSNSTLEETKDLLSCYVHNETSSSLTVRALQTYTKDISSSITLLEKRPYSSWRPYGLLRLDQNGRVFCLAIGSPEILLPHMEEGQEKERITALTEAEAAMGKRVLCLAIIESAILPQDLMQTHLAFVALITFKSQLRPGIKKALHFFEKRGVSIRIISGDHPETVRSVAMAAGVSNTDRLITGTAMQNWNEAEYLQVKNYTLFARIVPEQKEKIIQALKHDGFTAMVGDGANDALAIKQADLGIAMFDGANATRELASIVLMNNSFTALPGGVRLADSIIKNAEIFGSIFLGSAIVDGLLFLLVSLGNFSFPLTPLNITLINYFTIGIPGILVSYWTLWPTEETLAPSTPGFLQKIAPFMLISATLQAIILALLFFLSPTTMRLAPSNLFVIVGSIFTGYLFFLFTPRVFRGTLSLIQRRDLFLFTFIELLLLFLVATLKPLQQFFEVEGPLPATFFSSFLPLIVLFTLIQFVIARFLARNESP